MARKRLGVEQIIQKLREAELELARGQPVTQVVKKLGVTEQTYLRASAWRSTWRVGSQAKTYWSG